MTKTQLKANLTGLVILLVGSTVAIIATGGGFSDTPFGWVAALIADIIHEIIHLIDGGLMHAVETLLFIFTMLLLFAIPVVLIAIVRNSYRK